jgi:hypothetical protein
MFDDWSPSAWCADSGAGDRELNIIGMRLGPGKHLNGRTLLGGVVTPEQFDHFHEVSCSLPTFARPRAHVTSSSSSTPSSGGAAHVGTWTAYLLGT